MQQTTISGHHNTHYPIGEAVWLLAGIIILIASGDAFALLTAAVVIVALVWGMIRAIEHRVRNGAKSAPVIHLRPASTSRRDPQNTSADASQHRRSAA